VGYRLGMRQTLKKFAVIRRLAYGLQLLRAKGQSNENEIVARLAADAPKTFVEFGFHPAEFNCLPLARRNDWQGLLVDADPYMVADVGFFFSKRIRATTCFLTLDNLDLIRNTFDKLGVLSIDVDGNDYWFLKGLLDLHPAVICVEYNASFGLEPVTVPYDPLFDRHRKHPSGWYHGASITALAELAATADYGLAAVSEAGVNAFFTKDGRLDPKEAWRPNRVRDQWSGSTQAEQWQSVRELPLESV